MRKTAPASKVENTGTGDFIEREWSRRKLA